MHSVQQIQQMESQRNISEFILIGLSYDQNVKLFCLGLFLLCYVTLLKGNLLVLVSIQCSSLFHQPMYYFLSHLSSVDICYTSCMTPKLIGDLLVGTKTISYGSCMLQVFSMHFLGMTEVFILTVMAFDRCVAICKPLCYMILTNKTRCNLLVLAAWARGAVHSFSQFSMIIWLPFCGHNEILLLRYFPLLKIACTNACIIGFLVVANSGMVALVMFVLLFGSYVMILFTLRNHSAEGGHKALSTCGSHISVVVLFFGPLPFAYLRPPTTFPEDKIFSLFYTIFVPMVNPLIYTLRNTEMKRAMKMVWCQKIFSEKKT